jgi:glycosyltransferase involved in cell wall biosynthesis
MACGAPVVVGNCTSLPEVVGEAALTVNPYDVNALAQGLLDVVTQPELAARLRAAGPLRARQFTWDKAAEETRRALRAAADAQ